MDTSGVKVLVAGVEYITMTSKCHDSLAMPAGNAHVAVMLWLLTRWSALFTD